MKVSEQISLLLSGKVTYDQLKELKEEEKAEKENPEDKPEDNPEENPEDKPEEKPEDKPEEKPKEKPEEELKKALEQVEALTKQVEDLQKKNTQKDIEDKTGNDKFDMIEFVKNFRS